MIKQKIKYANGTIVQQAQNYINVYRILIEYVDNSIDDAEKIYESSTNSYTRNININVSKSGTTKGNRTITITDNACGINIDPNKDLTIFESAKRLDSKTNGMFGMGMFSFLSICNKMSVETRQCKSNTTYRFDITKNTFDIPNGSDPEFKIYDEYVNRKSSIGFTKITLSDFHPTKFEEIDMNIFKKEVELHFELILKRKNISITFQENNHSPATANSFDYSQISTTNYSKTIDKLYITKSKKYKTKTEINISSNPCIIFLVVSDSMELNREPVFVWKGRRVMEVSKVDQFRTNNKSLIWSNPNLTGYIDVTGILEPVPIRKDFKNTQIAKALFQELNKLEPEIKEFIDKQTGLTLSFNQSKIESKINEVVNNYLNSSDLHVDTEKTYKEYTLNSYYKKLSDEYNCIAANQKNLVNVKTPKSTSSAKKTRDKKITLRVPVSNSKSAGIKIKFDKVNYPQTDILGNPLRSIYRDDNIIIYQKHSEFLNKITLSRSGSYKINEKFIHYIAMEIITHLFSEQDENTDDHLFVKFTSSVYQLENSLYSINGLNF